MRFVFHFAAALAAALAIGGCTSLPENRGYAETGQLIGARLGTAPVWPPTAEQAAPPSTPSDLPTDPINIDDAIRLAFLHNPRIDQAYARLGLGRAELEEARRISNPAIGYSRLVPQSGSGAQITRSVSMSFTDLLLLPARKRFAAGEMNRLQNSVAASLLDLANEVEVAWYESVGASQVATMRDLVAQAAAQSAELAQRFFAAGNINRLQLEQEQAAATQAGIEAVRATAIALRARSKLAGLLSLPSDAPWTLVSKLPQPPVTTWSADSLVTLAQDQRLDLVAARQKVALREDALGVATRWRWLGTVDVGYERESEIDGGLLKGPSLSISLPIFNQGQAAIARARAQLHDARATRDALAMGVRNDAYLGLQRLSLNRDISERYRTLLLPSREAIVARSQEQVNFMLIGVFELIVARQQEYDAYQEYLEAVRDYWIARADLRHVVGGRLPDDGGALVPTIGVEKMLPSAASPALDHSMHAMPATEKSDNAGVDPHAGHTMPSDPPVDPHAGHNMSMPMDAPSEQEKPADDLPSEADAPPAHHQHGDTP